jgi:glycosyltransferase involved in cell wall biosynthesis
MPYDPGLLATNASPVQARRSLGLPEEAFIVACYGFVAGYKRMDVAVRSFRKLREHVPDSLLLIAGKVQEEYRATFSSLVDSSRDRVVCTGSLGPEKWLQAIRACDVCINLRYPTIGESSAVLSTLLAAGKPVMVSNVGSYAELPSGVVAKVDVGGEESEEAASLLVRWALDEGFRRGMAEEAQTYALKTLSPAAVAEAYSQAMRSL